MGLFVKIAHVGRAFFHLLLAATYKYVKRTWRNAKNFAKKIFALHIFACIMQSFPLLENILHRFLPSFLL